jgi:hypothetical protein
MVEKEINRLQKKTFIGFLKPLKMINTLIFIFYDRAQGNKNYIIQNYIKLFYKKLSVMLFGFYKKSLKLVLEKIISIINKNKSSLKLLPLSTAIKFASPLI